MTSEFGRLASIAAVGVAAGFFIVGVHHAVPGRPAAPVAPAPTAAPEQPQYEEGSARLVTRSVVGSSSSAIDPASYRPAPQPDPGIPVGAGPPPGLPDGPGPVPVPVIGVDGGEPRERLVEPSRIVEGDRPLVEQRVETGVRALAERERIRRAPHPERLVRPIERREERRVPSRAGAGPVFGQGPRRGFGSAGSSGGRGGARGGSHG